MIKNTKKHSALYILLPIMAAFHAPVSSTEWPLLENIAFESSITQTNMVLDDGYARCTFDLESVGNAERTIDGRITLTIKLANIVIEKRNPEADTPDAATIPVDPATCRIYALGVPGITTSIDDMDGIGIISDGDTCHSEDITISFSYDEYKNRKHDDVKIQQVLAIHHHIGGGITLPPLVGTATIDFSINHEATIFVEEHSVDLGTLRRSSDGGTYWCSEPRDINLFYAVLTDAKCEISSLNEFRLKHITKENSLIPYKVSMGAQPIETHIDGKKYISQLPASMNLFTVTIQAEINGILGQNFSVGTHKDRLTFTIVARDD
ncbi:MAG: hypothetical protein LBT67_01190 [Holosporaceae bacterium]|jgi:hypothetical protein|nr:hypothetical protein [Holosporaceae bacterium]